MMAEVELLDKEDYMEAYHASQNQHDQAERFDDFDEEWAFLSDKIIEHHFTPIRELIENVGYIQTTEIYRFLFSTTQQPPLLTIESWQAICELTQETIQNNQLLWEDVVPFLYGIDQIQGRTPFSHIRYLFIDEAQDYTPFQFAYIKQLFPNSRMTILGDLNQAIYPHAYASPSILEEGAAGPEKQERITLMTSYRSTRPIVNFTKQLVHDGKMIESFQRDGHKPTLTTVDSRDELHTHIYEKIISLQRDGLETIAIITKSLTESTYIYDWLPDELNVQKLDYDTYSFTKGILILPAYLAKGIEFDGVILYNASADVYYRESERKLFYTACTRAMHALHLFTIGKKSLFLENVDQTSYETR